MDRKGMKVAAKKAQRQHYWMIVAICLFASVFGVRCCVHFIDALGQHQHFDQHPANGGFHAIQRHV